MDLYEFITYCRLKGYVDDIWPATVSKDVMTVLLMNNEANIAARITYAKEGIQFLRSFNICDFSHAGASWENSSLEEIIQKIAPEL